VSLDNASRVDVVFIRVSTQAQDDKGQKDNVRKLLKELGVYVSDPNWFSGTVSRRKVKGNLEFSRLMEMVEADRVETVYIESQDRWGTSDRVELFNLLGILRTHNTRLFDLRDRKDLTEQDFATEMLAVLGSFKSEKELKDIAYRSLRTRVANFQDTGTWPTGTHPYGYGKACYSSDSRLKWVWYPVNRSKGQIFIANSAGELIPGPDNVKIPPKTKGQRELTVLVPSNNCDVIRAVKLIFDLYTRCALSRRQISVRLNAEGLTFNGRKFSHSAITNILDNPVYMGDTHFGKNQSGALQTFDKGGVIVEVKKKQSSIRRKDSECLVKKGTHEAIVDRETWEMAQKKLQAERDRTSYAPRNSDYYLKQLFVCGHCGKSMAAQTEIDRKTRRRTPVYVCSTYIKGRCGGYSSPCGYHRIKHDDAENLLLDKIKAMDLSLDTTGSEHARENFQTRLAHLGHADEQTMKEWQTWVEEGVNALVAYLEEAYSPDWPIFQRLRRMACRHYWEEKLQEDNFKNLPLKIHEFSHAVRAAEEQAVEEATQKIAELRGDHKKMTLLWMKASEMMQPVLKEQIDMLEREISVWQPRTVPLSDRLLALYAAEEARRKEREKLLTELPTLEKREKGEAFRRLFKTVMLYWEKTFQASEAKPCRPRKTNRNGRFRYHLQLDRTEWSFASSDLGGFS